VARLWLVEPYKQKNKIRSSVVDPDPVKSETFGLIREKIISDPDSSG
jgi:hypothetical protein